ncbi:MAG: ABC transporter ATP-binding protein [Coprobacillaceae bacterium]
MDNNDEVLTSKEQFQVLLRLLKYVLPYKKKMIIAFFMILIATISDILGPMIIKTVVDTYFRTNNIVMSGIVMYLSLYAFTTLVYAVFKYLQVYQFHQMGYRITKQLRVDVFTKLQSLGMRYFDQTPSGSIVSRVTNDTDAIQDMLNNVLSVVISSIILMSGIIIAMLIIDPMLTLLCLLFLPIGLYIIYLYQKYSTRFYQIAREKLSQLNTKLSESISGMNIIQAFHQESRLSEEFDTINEEYYQASLKNIRLDGLLLAPIVHLLIAFALTSILGFAGFQSFHGFVSTGVIIAFTDYVYKFFDPMFQVMERLAIYQQAIVASHRIFKILDHEEVAPKQIDNADAIIQDAKIEFKNVSFSYDGKNEVLSDISFTVNPGETVALVGHTGSGKSSIINVMMRFYEFSQGEVLIDGKSIKEYPMEHLRDKIGLVLQDPFMYYGTINDNIRLLNKDITDQEIIDACKFVQVDSFVEQLDNTYQHQVIERGAAFSTGQKQLLVFARTIVTDPKILVLDEATANIDTETESLIQESLNKIKKGRTTIAIAHRLSTIKDANQILVLDKGKIIERGNHQELIDNQGVYYAMYQLQQTGME